MDIPSGRIHIVSMRPRRGRKTYYYARKTARVNGRPRVVWSLPLGTAEDIVRRYSGRVLGRVEFRSFSFGLAASFLAVAEMTGFFDIVDAAAPKKMLVGRLTTAQYVLAMMAGRAVGPLSKAETGRRFSEAFLSLIWRPVHRVNTQNLVNHMDRLSAEAVDRITESFGAVLVSLGLRPSLVLWDHTNFSTNIENWGEKLLPQAGNAKDKRFDKNIVGTTIALSKEEIPLYHLAYPGNENDAHLFSRCVNDIVAKIQRLCRQPLGKKMTIVFDKGNNSEDNIQKALENAHVVGSLSFDEAPELLDVPLEDYRFIYRTRNGTALKAHRTTRELWDTEFTVIATHNPETEKRQRRTWDKAKEKINKRMAELKEKFEKKNGRGRRMTAKGLTTSIAQAIPRQYRATYWWDIDGGNRRFTWKLLEENEEKMRKKFGKTLLFTDHLKWDTQRIAKTYHTKHKVEKTFRWLHDKLLIPIPPVYHNKDERIRVHIFLCIMTLTFLRLIKRQLKGTNISDEQLLEELRNLKVALAKDTKTGETQLKVMEMSPTQATVFTHLKLDRYIKAI